MITKLLIFTIVAQIELKIKLKERALVIKTEF